MPRRDPIVGVSVHARSKVRAQMRERRVPATASVKIP